jgi:predicted nucleotidyltransferase
MGYPIKEIVKRIVEEIDPDKIILFGSRAKGKNKKGSDYDICVLKKNVKNRRKLAQRIYRKLFGVGVSVDVIVETSEKFNELKDKWFLVYSEIAKDGRLIYEK